MKRILPIAALSLGHLVHGCAGSSPSQAAAVPELTTQAVPTVPESAKHDEQPVAMPDAGPSDGEAASSLDSAHAAGHEHGGGEHMKHMATVRDMLKWRLGTAYDAPLPTVSAADLAAGKVLYAKHCSTCHGTAGRGDGPAAKDLPTAPSDHTDAEHSRYYSDSGRLWIVRHGVPNTSMPGFLDKLGERGTLQVYAYARSLAGAKSGKAHSHDHGHGHDHAH